MKNIRCYIIDDESDAIELLKNYIEATPGLELCGYSENPLEALDFLTSAQSPDLTFVDIDMRLLNGLELAGLVNFYTTLIFTTAFPQFALQAFEKEAFDYLLKPIDYEKFLKSVQRVKRKWLRANVDFLNNDTEYFNIKSQIKGRMVRLRFDEVIFIEGAVNYVLIHTTTDKHMTYLTLKEVMQHFPSKIFARIHRSFVININHTKIIERNQVQVTNGRYLPMGDNYKQRFLDDMDGELLSSDRAS